MFGLIFAWFVVVVVMVDREPDRGAPTLDRLATQYERALRTHDTGVLGRDAPGVPVPACADPHVGPVTAGGTAWIEVDDSAGTMCARLPTGRVHGWWIVR